MQRTIEFAGGRAKKFQAGIEKCALIEAEMAAISHRPSAPRFPVRPFHFPLVLDVQL